MKMNLRVTSLVIKPFYPRILPAHHIVLPMTLNAAPFSIDGCIYMANIFTNNLVILERLATVLHIYNIVVC